MLYRTGIDRCPDPCSAGRARRPIGALLALFLVALVAAGCSSGGEAGGGKRPTSTTTGADASGGTPPPQPNPGAIVAEPSAAVRQAVAALPGRLAVGAGPALGLVDPDGAEAAPVEETAGAVASQPTWSHDGARLAWSRTTDSAVEVVSRDLATGQDVVTDLTTTPGFYFQWSSDDDTLAYLRTDPNQAGFELGLIDPGSPPVRLGAASPVFVSWAPSTPVLAAHVAAEQVLVLPSPFAAPGATTLQASSVLTPTGPFATPAWVDDATVLAVSPDEGLVTLDAASGDTTPVLDTGGQPVRFVLSPDRGRVAVASVGSPSGSVSPAGLTAGAQSGGQVGLRIVELATGEITPVTSDSPLAFEWAPDSVHLAWLEEGVSAAVPRARWNFWDGQTSTPSVSYQLSETVKATYLPFFEQYAQSMTGWSPDAAAFAFAGHPDGGPEGDGVWVQLVGVPGAPPVRVADGDVVAWSP